MAAPDLTKRSAAFVAKWGTNDPGYNAVGAPMAFLTIAAALADLAANYPTASATNPLVVSIEPGTFTTPAFALPPFTFVVGNPDGPTDPTSGVIVSLTGNITLAAGWSVNQTAFGGFLNLTFRQTSSQNLDFTMPAPSAGNPSRRVTFNSCRTDSDNFIWAATGTGDILSAAGSVHDGNSGDLVSITSGTVLLDNFRSAAPVAFASSTTVALSAQIYGLFISATPSATTPGLTFTSDATALLARMGACDNRALTLNRAGAGALDVYADAVSIPLVANITYAGTATTANLHRTTDGGGIGPGVLPTAYAASANATGNTTLTTTANIYSTLMTVTTNDGRTSVAILAIPASVSAGDCILINFLSTGLTTPVIQVRNATAGGALLYSYLCADGENGFAQFVYTGTAWQLEQSVRPVGTGL